jgi:excinuclease ABC subunit B
VADIMEGARVGGPMSAKRFAKVAEETAEYAALSPKQMAKRIQELEKEMYQHARDLEFEEAARLRDQIKSLQGKGLLA